MKNIFLLFVAILALFLIKQSFEEIDECERNEAKKISKCQDYG
jgi:hypothetical protein